jgi:hypothetical protein
MDMVRRRPWTGYGIGQFPIAQRAFTHKGNPLQFGNIHPGLSHQAHNLYAQTAAELGIPGLALLISIVLVFVTGGVKRMLALEPGIRRNLLMGDTTGRGQPTSFQGAIHYSTKRVFTTPDPGAATVRGTYQETAGQQFSISAQTVITIQ